MRIVPTVLFIILLAGGLSAADWYADPSMPDNTGDGSAISPWRTLEEVFSDGLIESKDKDGGAVNAGAPVKAGDTIYLRSGYHGDINESGYFNDDYITITAEVGHTPQLKRFKLWGAQKWIIRGLTISPSFAPVFERVTIVDFYSRSPGSRGVTRDLVVEECLIFTVADASGWSAADWDTRSLSKN